MATIVQPYNPWREQLAANILGPLVGGMIQRGQEAEQNRKMNALRGELNRRMTETPDSLTAALATDPADALPQTPKLGGAANPQQVLAELMATPRFGMLSPQKAYEAMGPYLQDYQAQHYLKNLAGAESWDEYMRGAAAAGAMGYMPHQVVDTMKGYALGRQPDHKLNTIDTGTGVLGIDYNPATGGVRSVFNAGKGVSPDTQARVGLGYAELGEKRREFDATYSETVTNNEFNRKMEQWKLENPESQIVKNDLGDHVEIYAVNPRTGETKELFNGKVGISPKDAALAENNRDKTQMERDKLNETKRHNEAAEEIQRNKPTVQPGAVTEKDLWEKQSDAYDKQIAAVQKEKAEIRKEITDASAGGRRNPPGHLTQRLEKLEERERQLVEAQRNLLLSGKPELPAQEQPAPQTTETPETMIADVSNDPAQVMPQTPATPPAPVVPQGTASADVAPQTTQTVGVDVAPPTKAEYEAMCRKYGKDVVDEAMRRDGVAIPR